VVGHGKFTVVTGLSGQRWEQAAPETMLFKLPAAAANISGSAVMYDMDFLLNRGLPFI
jgi:hypothetical protein